VDFVMRVTVFFCSGCTLHCGSGIDKQGISEILDPGAYASGSDRKQQSGGTGVRREEQVFKILFVERPLFNHWANFVSS
jgi:hypothetical protein